MDQISFDPLDYADSGEAKRARNAKLRALRQAGANARGWTLPNQCRPYASFGVPDGRVRNVYYVTIYDAPRLDPATNWPMR